MIDYIELWDKFFRGETSPAEESALAEWLADKSETDPELAECYKTRWESVTNNMDAEVKTHIRSRIEAKINDNEANSRQKSYRRKPLTILVPWVAAVSVSILACVGWFNYVNLKNGNSNQFEVFTERGQKANILLPDGTRVWLNSDSRLCYGNDYNTDRRCVTLSGEGYFEVAGNPDKTFCVDAGGYTVEALGTAFNIKSYSDDRYSFTTLIEGKILIEDDNGFSMVLAPMESLSFDTDSGQFSMNDSYRNHLAGEWRRNELIIESGTTLEMLTNILARQYNIGFIFRSDSIKRLCFEGVIKDSNLANVLQLIELSGEVVYSIEDNTIILDEKR